MGRPTKEAYALKEDLAWFDRDSYAPLKTAPISVWSTVVDDRLGLLRFVESGQAKAIASVFERLKRSPLQPLGFAQTYSGAAHDANTPTVKMMTGNRVGWMHRALVDDVGIMQAHERIVIDDHFSKNEEWLFADQAHLMVSMTATDAQLKKDFSVWLERWRKQQKAHPPAGNYKEKVKSWATSGVVPYMDLQLFTLITGKAISDADRLLMIHGDVDPTYGQSLEERMKEQRPKVFSKTAADVLRQLAQEE